MPYTLDDINLTKSEVNKFVEQYFGDDQSLISFNIKKYSEDSVGFLGNHFVLSLQIKNGQQIDNASFFIKIKPKLDEHAKYVEEIGAFKKEVQIFQNLMKELQDITSFNKKQWSPTCYLIKDNILMFEDLSIKKYVVAGNRGILDLNHAKAAVQALARFHASSIIWEKFHQVNICDKYPSCVTEVGYANNPTRTQWLAVSSEAIVHLCREIGHDVSESKMKSFINDAAETVKPSKTSLNVLSHGDLWASNLMYNYSSSGSVDNCIIIDFQFGRYSPCAVDLICMLSNILSSETRVKYIDSLCQEYYKNLSEILLKYSILINDFFDIHEFLEGCTFYKKLGVIEACLFGTIIYLPSSISTDVLNSSSGCHDLTVGNKSKICLHAFKEDEFYRMRMTELLNDLVVLFNKEFT